MVTNLSKVDARVDHGGMMAAGAAFGHSEYREY
jgi:hypothetical protein